MKKDCIFAPILFVIALLLFMLRATGMTAHIIISVLGVAALVAYAVLTKKDWKIPALEIATRVMYGIALITGIIIKAAYVVALAVMHKIFAVLFVVGLIALLVHKFITEKKAN